MVLTLSVITPSYQQEQFIERTIRSVLSQNISDIEYVVCDGGSEDRTVAVLERYTNSLRWISEPDEGQAHAVNKGLAMTTGDIIAWINSDDVYYPHAFQRVLDFFEVNPNTLAVYGQADWIDELDNVVAPYPTRAWDYYQLIKECYLCQPAVFFRRSLVEKLGDLKVELQYCMDYELWLRYGQIYPFTYLPIKLAGSRIYSTNKTFGNRLAAHREANEMLREKLGYSTRHWIYEYSRLQLEENNQDALTEVPSLITLEFLVTAMRNCWFFNKRAMLVVLFKVMFSRLIKHRGWLRSHQQFDVDNAVFKQHHRP